MQNPKSYFYLVLLFFPLFFGGARVVANLTPTPEIPQVHRDIMKEDVTPKLQKTRNMFALRKPPTFIKQAYAAEPFDGASALLAVDLDTGEILYEKNLDERLPIASITKVMSSVVALDLASPDTLFAVSEEASKVIPTRIGVVPHQQMTLEELIEGMLLTSANDTAEVVREGIDNSYKESVFIKAMNEKAKFLGLSNSSFSNPQGFDSSSNYSTVRDLAILSHYALKNYPVIAKAVRKDYQFLAENRHHKQYDLFNWNGLIGVYPRTIGMKIGYTEDAGKTTAVVSERNGKRILAVVLGAPDLFARDLWAARLLDIGYEKTLGLAPIEVTKKQLQDKYNSWSYK